jgi:hypothetical protein
MTRFSIHPQRRRIPQPHLFAGWVESAFSGVILVVLMVCAFAALDLIPKPQAFRDLHIGVVAADKAR